MRRLGLLALLAAVLAVTALAWARAYRTPSPEDRTSAALPQPVATAPAPGAPGPAAPPAATPPAPKPPAVSVVAPPRAEDEAAASRIDGLVQAGDIGRARDAAEEFLRRYPKSSYCQHIETLTGVHPRPPIPGEQ
jgi:hypothetical protein